MRVTETLRDRLETDGFAVIEGFAPAEAIAAVRARAAEIVEAFDPSEASGVFSRPARRSAPTSTS